MIPALLNKFFTVSVGIAPFLSHSFAASLSILISAGVVNGLYVPIFFVLKY